MMRQKDFLDILDIFYLDIFNWNKLYFFNQLVDSYKVFVYI